MALNDGYAVDTQGRRIYFPPIGQPRLVPSHEQEARLNGAAFTYGLVTFGISVVVALILNTLPEKPFEILGEVMLPVLVAHQMAASLLARRWPALNDRNYTYHRFVVSTLSRQSATNLYLTLLLTSVVAIGLVWLTGWMSTELQSDWATEDWRKNGARLVAIPLFAIVAMVSLLHAYRISAALRKQRARRALG
jgi:hypothetical protein